MKDLLSIVSHFQLADAVREIKPLGSGLINDTYKVITENNNPDYVLQRINHAIFQNVDMLQANIEAVTRHIRTKLQEKGNPILNEKSCTSSCRQWQDLLVRWRELLAHHDLHPPRKNIRNCKS